MLFAGDKGPGRDSVIAPGGWVAKAPWRRQPVLRLPVVGVVP